jgi:hypothetical protein
LNKYINSVPTSKPLASADVDDIAAYISEYNELKSVLDSIKHDSNAVKDTGGKGALENLARQYEYSIGHMDEQLSNILKPSTISDYRENIESDLWSRGLRKDTKAYYDAYKVEADKVYSKLSRIQDERIKQLATRFKDEVGKDARDNTFARYDEELSELNDFKDVLYTTDEILKRRHNALIALESEIKAMPEGVDKQKALQRVAADSAKLLKDTQSHRDDMTKKERDYVSSRVDAGMSTDVSLIKFDIRKLQDEMTHLTDVWESEALTDPNRSYVEDRLAEASIALTKAFNDLEQTVTKQRDSVMSQVKDYAAQRDEITARMSNDALYHSINMMMLSNVKGVETISTPNVHNARSAQSAVSRSLDAWIVEQRYTQANIGRTVADIYEYMKNTSVIIGG